MYIRFGTTVLAAQMPSELDSLRISPTVKLNAFLATFVNIISFY